MFVSSVTHTPRPDRRRVGRSGSAIHQADRMEDGIAEAVAASGLSSVRFYPEDYAPPLTAREFVDELPANCFPKPLIAKMLADFEIEMKQTISTLGEQGDSLSEADVFAIFTYTYELLGNDWQIYSEVNRIMREHVPQDVAFWRPLIFHLDCALGKLPSHEHTAYRAAVRFDPELYLEGNRVIWPAFSSASVNMGVVNDFIEDKRQDVELEGQGTVFVLTTKSARRVHTYSHFPEEEEVLFPPNSVFHVTNRTSPETKLLLGISHDIIHLEQVS
eukprot:GGOE01012079.1.p1 GENE.GGOE01012079.1~~GGOE01012079.1.p1  ORF type:complete len:274 (-),score=70.94 GGOE01012079.1:623-1444(-)